MGLTKRKGKGEKGEAQAEPEKPQKKVEQTEKADEVEEGFDSVFLKVPRRLIKGYLFMVYIVLILYFMWKAYSIRLSAVRTYGRVIHEFDPWFNFRASQYLADNGWYKFFHWYDYMSWYPLGRPVGTTIYPGMQIASVWIWEAMKSLPTFAFKVRKEMPIVPGMNVTTPYEFRGKYNVGPMSLNDVCVFVPAWFGAVGSVLLGLLTTEATGKWACGLVATGIMAIIPAHFSRGIAGGYDNESVAITAMCLTFWLWCRATRDSRAWVWGIPAGLAYVFMAATWGGYIFVVNMVAAHAGLLLALGRYNWSLYRAYTLFFIVGTLGAMQVPVIGWQPLKSMEQVAALVVFLVFQFLAFCDWVRIHYKLSTINFVIFRGVLFGVIMVGITAVVKYLFSTGYFSPLGARIRGLFIQHTKTGNPLVDSVAEHQAASTSAFYYYHHNTCYLAPFGLLLTILRPSNGNLFLALYAVIAYYFSLKMSRLIIICGPIASALSGVLLGGFIDLCLRQVTHLFDYTTPRRQAEEEPRTGGIASVWNAIFTVVGLVLKWPKKALDAVMAVLDKWPFRVVRAVLGIGMLYLLWFGDVKGPHLEYLTMVRRSVPPPFQTITVSNKIKLPFTKYLGKKLDLPVLGHTRVPTHIDIPFGGKYVVGGPTVPSVRPSDEWWPRRALKAFKDHAEMMAEQMSSPQIMFKTQDGRIIDDYRDAYFWLRDNTPEDARVMAWWDYGYQITGIGNRTTIADGNTWNHEHIATLGKMLTSPEDRAHAMVRHLADYVLIWGGGRGDDLAKSIHMARIGTSIYSDICPGDPTCSQFGFDRSHNPTPMMARSLLYKLHSHGQKGVVANPKLWKDVYMSKHGLVRIFQVQNIHKGSREWIADPANRVCDAPGSWYCVGQYPPKFLKYIEGRKDFAQLEDFNRKQQQNAYSKAVLDDDARV
eukprot:Hpha_TRINITY_DN15763_c5_g12::TRINITY_DN15763_c5_g12_i1::g.37016::m.37016/K07151/STT3; dolichyl-diphosphooligosaccharide--protein glycosyltransferase